MPTLVELFEARVIRGSKNECWRWLGYISDDHGYGQISIGGYSEPIVTWRAHRLSFFLHNGYLTEGLMVMHSCDNRWCVNPHHLSEGTAKDNWHDAFRKGRVRMATTKDYKFPTCRRGHKWLPETTAYNGIGNRYCLTCKTASDVRRGRRATIITAAPAVEAAALSAICGEK